MQSLPCGQRSLGVSSCVVEGGQEVQFATLPVPVFVPVPVAVPVALTSEWQEDQDTNRHSWVDRGRRARGHHGAELRDAQLHPQVEPQQQDQEADN